MMQLKRKKPNHQIAAKLECVGFTGLLASSVVKVFKFLVYLFLYFYTNRNLSKKSKVFV